MNSSFCDDGDATADIKCILRTVPFVVVLLVAVSSAEVAASSPDSSIRQFVDSVWRPSPATIDLVVRKTITRPAKTEKQIRKIANSAYKGVSAQTGEPVDPKMVELSVKDTMSREGKPFSWILRYRIKGDLQRIDRSEQISEPVNEELSTDTTDEGVVFAVTDNNGVRDSAGIVESISYDHARKSATLTVDRVKPFAGYEDAWRIAEVDPEIWTMIRMATGRKTTKTNQFRGQTISEIVQDEAKSQMLADGKADLVITHKSAVVNSVGCDEFSIGNAKQPLIAKVWSNAGQPNQVLKSELYLNGNVQKRIEATEFGSRGFPKYWCKTAFKAGGEMKEEVSNGTQISRTLLCRVSCADAASSLRAHQGLLREWICERVHFPGGQGWQPISLRPWRRSRATSHQFYRAM